MLRHEVPIDAHETAGELQARLAAEGARLIVPALDALATGTARFEPQDAAQANYAHKLEKSEARLSWRTPARELERRIRAFNPWPIAETTLDGAQLRIHEAEVVAAQSGQVPGTILRAGAEGIVVMTAEEALAIRRLQLPGRRVVPAADFANARRLAGLVLT
jgi:methionyl-tRNA formyltransferase